MSGISKVWGVAAFAMCAACLSWSEAEAGRGRHCHCQPMYTNTTTAYAAPAANVASTNGRQRYQSAYSAPGAPIENGYIAPSAGYRVSTSPWDRQTNEARHIKGL